VATPATHQPRHAFIRQLGKHQVASVVATLVDYLTMIVMVSVAGVSPVEATVLGAACGGFTNFAIGRNWTFRATHRGAYGQALRYALVSGLSLGLNGLGEYLLWSLLGLQYIVARVITSLIVSVAWNFPLHRYFVFRH
jgi:putative flippase GtrA